MASEFKTPGNGVSDLAGHNEAWMKDPKFLHTTQSLKRKVSQAKAQEIASKKEESQKALHKAWMYPELQWGITPSLTSRTDYAWFLKVWELLTAVACLYVGFMVPFSLGFEKYYLGDGEQCLFSPKATIHGPSFYITRVIDILVDIVFWIDIFINFVSARWVLKMEPMVHWVLVDDMPEIADLYLRDMFVIDFLGSLPVQHLDCIPGVDASFLKFARLLRLFKLFRLSRLSNMIKILEEHYPSSVYFVAFIQLFLYFFLMAHWTACIFFWIGYGLADPFGTAWEQHLFTEGWVGPNKDGILDENGEEPEFGTGPWISAMYWAVTTMSTIGYGDISPGTAPERLLGMVLMCIGCAFFAWITGKITQLMTERSACETRFDEIIEDLDAFMDQRILPEGLRLRIRNYYKVKFPNKQVFDERAIINDIEAPALRKEIVLHLYRDVVQKVPLFRIAEEGTQREICFRLRSIYRMPGRVITLAGTEPDNMYVIRFGQVTIQGSGPKSVVGKQGDLFGELAIMGLSPDGLRIRTASAATVCELCELSATDFRDLLASQPNFLSTITQVSRMHMMRLKKNYIDAKNFFQKKSGEIPVDFYDTMAHIEWKNICDVLEEAGEGERFRSSHAKCSNEDIDMMEKETAKKMLSTSFKVQINSIGPLKGMCTSGLVVMSWPGVPNLSLSSSRNETELFSFSNAYQNKAGYFEIHKDLEFPVIYPHEFLGSPIRKENLKKISRSMSDQKMSIEAEIVEGGAFFGNSMVYPESKPILVGKIELMEFIKNRGRLSGRKSFLVPLKCLESGSIVNMDCTVDVRRNPRSKKWGRIMHNVLGMGSSQYFLDKLNIILTKIEDREEDFIAEVRKKRLEVMATFRDKKPSKADMGFDVPAPLNSGLLGVPGAPDVHGMGQLRDLMLQMMQTLDKQSQDLNNFKESVAARLNQQDAMIEVLKSRDSVEPNLLEEASPPVAVFSFPGASPRQQRLFELQHQTANGTELQHQSANRTAHTLSSVSIKVGEG